MKVFKAIFKLYDSEYKKNLNRFVELEEQGKITITSCYPRNGYMYIKYEADEEY